MQFTISGSYARKSIWPTGIHHFLFVLEVIQHNEVLIDIHSFTKHFLDAYSVLGTLLDVGATSVMMTDKILVFLEPIF